MSNTPCTPSNSETSFFIWLVSSAGMLVPNSWLTGEDNISIPALMMTMEIMAPRIPSSETPHISMMPAEMRVAKVIIASNRASEPEAIKASLFNCSPLPLTYLPNTSFTTMATTITMSVVVVYSGWVGWKIFLTDSISDVIPADSTMTAIIIALKYSMRPKPKGCFLSAGR